MRHLNHDIDIKLVNICFNVFYLFTNVHKLVVLNGY